MSDDKRRRRVVCWWSAGIASSVATAITLKASAWASDEKIAAYCDTSATEHPDNARYLADCERWYGQSILRLRSTEYTDIYDVFERTRWLVGIQGARCTTELKKKVRRTFERPDDVQIFGFCADTKERVRADRFKKNNPEIDARFPLIEAGLTHVDCQALIRKIGIEMPAMYRLGYKNNNCIGCVKGGAGYWNKIRRDFPAQFARMAQIERGLDVAILKKDVKGERVRIFLDELPEKMGRYEAEEEIECGVACGTTLATL